MTKLSLSLLFVAGLSMGCSSGSVATTGDLAYVDDSILRRTDLALALDGSGRPAPMTSGTEALPVEIEVFGNVAAAFRRGENGIAERTRSNLVSVWRVVGLGDGSARTPVSGVTGPDYAPITALPPIDLGLDAPGDAFLSREDSYALIDWRDQTSLPPQELEALLDELRTAHPVCF